jgi:acyl-CoA-binding protein
VSEVVKAARLHAVDATRERGVDQWKAWADLKIFARDDAVIEILQFIANKEVGKRSAE